MTNGYPEGFDEVVPATSDTGYDPAWGTAIAGIESQGSGGYQAIGPRTKTGDRAYGKYQVMGANIPEWTKAATGKALTTQEFVSSPEAQDATFKHQFTQLVAKYGNPQDAASAWFTGKPLAQGAGKKDVLGTSGADYVKKFTQASSGYPEGFDEVVPSRSLGGAIEEGAKRLVPETQEKMAHFEGMSPEQASSEAQSSLVQGLEGVGKVAAGGISKLLPGDEKVPEEGDFDAFVQQWKQILGPDKWSRFKNYIATQPEEALTDVAAFGFPLGRAEKLAGEAVPETASLALKREGVAAIKSAKQSGLKFNPSKSAPMMEDIRSTLDTMNYDAPTHYAVSRALGNMDRLISKSSITPEQQATLETLGPRARAQARLQMMDKGPGHDWGDIHNAMIGNRRAIAKGGTQGAMGSMMQQKLENYARSLPKGPEFLAGMEKYSQALKLRQINQIKAAVQHKVGARVTRAGWAHALSQEFNKIAGNENKLGLWKPDEQVRIKQMADKNLAPKIIKTLSQFAPTGIGRQGLDLFIGSILSHIIPGATPLLVGTGAAARGIETSLAKKGVRGFEKLVAAGGKEGDLEKLISPDVLKALKAKPATNQAIKNWTTKATRLSVRTLAVSIAKELNTPALVPRIEKEITDISPEQDQ